jgi:hypothetical protein
MYGSNYSQYPQQQYSLQQQLNSAIQYNTKKTFLTMNDASHIIEKKRKDFESAIFRVRRQCDDVIKEDLNKSKIPTIFKIPKAEMVKTINRYKFIAKLVETLKTDGFVCEIIDYDKLTIKIYPNSNCDYSFMNVDVVENTTGNNCDTNMNSNMTSSMNSNMNRNMNI